MPRYSLALALLVSIHAHAMDTYRIGNRVVEVGDSAGKLTEFAGTPQFKEPIEWNRAGTKASAGNTGSKTATVTSAQLTAHHAVA